MKHVAFLVVLLLPALGAPSRSARAIDDPPPESDNCPLCGGDPALHVAKTFAILDSGSDLAVHVLRW